MFLQSAVLQAGSADGGYCALLLPCKQPGIKLLSRNASWSSWYW